MNGLLEFPGDPSSIHTEVQLAVAPLTDCARPSTSPPDLPVVLPGDAPAYGIGAVLQRQNSDSLKYVAFALRTLLLTGCRY